MGRQRPVDELDGGHSRRRSEGDVGLTRKPRYREDQKDGGGQPEGYDEPAAGIPPAPAMPVLRSGRLLDRLEVVARDLGSWARRL